MSKYVVSFILFFSGLSAAQDVSHPFAVFDLASEPVLNDPHDLAIGPDGHLYVADKFGNRIAVFNAQTLELVEMLGEGNLPSVHDISFGQNGRVAIAVTGASVVAVYSDVGDAGEQPDEVLAAPRTEGVLIHSNGNIYAMASGAGVVLAYENGQIVNAAEGHPGAHDIAEDLQGNIWVADSSFHRLVKYSADLKLLQVIDHSRFGFLGPRYLDVDDFGRLVVADQDAHRILLIDPEGADGGTLLGVLGDGIAGLGPNKFDDPEGVAVKGNHYYIADSDNNRIVRYSIVLY